MRRKILIIPLIGIVLAFGVAAFIFFHWIPLYGKGLLEKIASRELAGEVSIGSLELKVPSGLLLRDVKVKGKDITLTAEKLNLFLSPFQGILGRAQVKKLEVENFSVEVLLKTDPRDKRFSLRELLEKLRMKHVIYFDIKSLIMKNGTIFLKKVSPSGEYEVSAFVIQWRSSFTFPDVKISQASVSLGKIEIKTPQGSFFWDEVKVTGGNVNFYSGDFYAQSISAAEGHCEGFIEDVKFQITEALRIGRARVHMNFSQGCGGWVVNSKLRGGASCRFSSLGWDVVEETGKIDFFECSLENVEFDKFKFGSGLVKGSVKDYAISISHFAAKMMGGVVSGSGEIDLKKSFMGLNVDLNGVTIQDIVTSLGLEHSRVTGDVYARSVSVTTLDFKNFDIEGNLKVKNFFTLSHDYRQKDNLVIVSAPEGEVEVKGTFTRDAFVMTSAQVRLLGKKSFVVEGSIGYSDMLSLHVKGTWFPLGYIREVAGVDVDGEASIECEVETDYEDVEVRGFFNAKNGKILGFNFERLSAKVEFEGDILSFYSISGFTQAGPVKGFVNLIFRDPSRIEGKLFSPEISPQLLKNDYADLDYFIGIVTYSPPPVKDVHLTLRGPLEDIDVTFKGFFNNFKVKQSRQLLSGEISGRFKGGVFSLVIRSRPIFYTLKVVPSDAPEDLYVFMRTDIKEAVFGEMDFIKSTVSGWIEAELKEDRWYISGNGIVRRDREGFFPGRTFSFSVTNAGTKMFFTGEEEPISASFDWVSSLIEVDVRAEGKERVFSYGALEGFLSGNMKVSLKTDEFFYAVEFPSKATLYLLDKVYKVPSGWKVELFRDRGNLKAEGDFLLISQDSSEYIKVTGEKNLEVKISSLIDAVARSLISPYIRISADIEGNADLGSLRVWGTLRFDSLESESAIFSPADRRWNYSITVKRFELSGDRGSRIVGTWVPLKYSVNFKDVVVRLRGETPFSILCSGGGTEEALSFNCSNLTQRLYYDMSWYTMVSKKESSEKRFESPIPLRITLSLKDLVLYSENQNILLNGEIDIFLKKELSISGELNFIGRYRFRNLWFDVKNGTFILNPSRPGVPYVSALATTEVIALEGIEKRYRINVELEGWVDKLRMRFSSSPSLEESKILSLITFGVPEATAVSGGAQASNVEKVTLGMEFLFGREMKDVGRRLGISELALTSTYEELTQRLSSRLRIASQLSPKVKVEYERDIMRKDQSISVMYSISRKVILEGTWDNRAFDISENVSSPIGNFGLRIRTSLEFDW